MLLQDMLSYIKLRVADLSLKQKLGCSKVFARAKAWLKQANLSSQIFLFQAKKLSSRVQRNSTYSEARSPGVSGTCGESFWSLYRGKVL